MDNRTIHDGAHNGGLTLAHAFAAAEKFRQELLCAPDHVKTNQRNDQKSDPDFTGWRQPTDNKVDTSCIPPIIHYSDNNHERPNKDSKDSQGVGNEHEKIDEAAEVLTKWPGPAAKP